MRLKECGSGVRDFKGRYVAGIFAEFYSDQVDRQVKAAIFVCISLLLQLCHCRAFRCDLHHFELEEIDVVVEVNGHVQTALTTAVFYRDI